MHFEQASSRGRHSGWIEEQVYAMSMVEAMDNIDNQRHEVLSNWEESRIICDMERTSVVWVWEDD